MDNYSDQENLDYDAPYKQSFTLQSYYAPLYDQPIFDRFHHSLEASAQLAPNTVDCGFEIENSGKIPSEFQPILSEFRFVRSEYEHDLQNLQRAVKQHIKNNSVSQEDAPSSHPGPIFESQSDEPIEEIKQSKKSTRTLPFQKRKLKPLVKPNQPIIIPDPKFQPPQVPDKQLQPGNTTMSSPPEEHNQVESEQNDEEEMDYSETTYDHPGMSDFWIKIDKKYSPKKGKASKQLDENNLIFYAKDELSKKILRHLTSHDRSQLKWPRSVKANKTKQFDYIRKYLMKTYGIQVEQFDRILRNEEGYIVTLYCSINTRNSKQIEFAKKQESEPAQSEVSRPGRRKASDSNSKLFSRTEHKKKVRTLDRSNLLTGSKQSVIKLFKTEIGRLIYFEPFCTLWQEFVQLKVKPGSDVAAQFNQYLEDIKEEVTGVKE